MNNRKNQNSLLVLATLGVYLGLVLAGATPQVLAQAATAKQFNVKDEIEVQDKLDKDPDNDLSKFGDIYFRNLNHLLSDLAEDGELPENFNGSFITHSPCPPDGSSSLLRGVIGPRSEHYKNLLINAWVTAQRSSNFVSDCRPYHGFEQTNTARKFRVDVRLDRKEFKYELSFDFASAERAESVLENLRSIFGSVQTKDENEKLSVLHKQTQLTSVDNQVIVVTRLPRAGLDSLLASDAK